MKKSYKGFSLYALIILSVLIVTQMFTNSMSDETGKRIEYSEMLARIEKGEIAQVALQEDVVYARLCENTIPEVRFSPEAYDYAAHVSADTFVDACRRLVAKREGVPADEITDLESFAKYSGSLVPIGAQNAQYAIVDNYNKSHPDNQINLVAGDQFEAADAYQWVLEGRYDAYFNIKTSYEANVEAEDGEYHEYADKLRYVTYEGVPTWPLFNLNNQELAEAYDEAWEQLEADGTLERLQQEYFGYSLFDYVPEGYQIGDAL